MATLTALKSPNLYDLAILADPATVYTGETETSFTATNGDVQIVAGLDAEGQLTSLEVRTRSGLIFTTAYTVTGLSVYLDAFLPLLETGPYLAIAELFNGKDTVVGSNVDDELLGFQGRDTIRGGDGEDWLEGDEGADTLIGGDDGDTILGGVGNDTLRGGKGDDFFSSGAGKDLIDGGKGRDVADFRSLVDDLVVTLDGDKPVVAKVGGVKQDVLKSIEIVMGGEGDDRVTGDERANALRGDSGDDRLSGEAGNDTLSGGFDEDRLNGGNGKDALDGAEGSDVLTGGKGADVFTFRNDLGPGNVDKITDFAVGIDKIELSYFIFDKLTPADTLDPDFFEVGPADDADDYIVYLPGTGELFYDANGDGAGGAVLVATVGKNLALSASDFIVT